MLEPLIIHDNNGFNKLHLQVLTKVSGTIEDKIYTTSITKKSAA